MRLYIFIESESKKKGHYQKMIMTLLVLNEQIVRPEWLDLQSLME